MSLMSGQSLWEVFIHFLNVVFELLPQLVSLHFMSGRQ